MILGASGSGKSTLLKMINRLVTPTSGRVTLNGTAVEDYNPQQLHRQIGYVFQAIGLFPHLTIYDNLALVLQLEKVSHESIQQRVHQVMQQVNLDPAHFLQRYPDELSGGQQQRVGVARALITQPSVLLMDEPFSALDAINRRELQQLIKHIHQQLDTTIIFVTHDLTEAFRLADNIAILNQGQLQQVGCKKTIIEQPATDYVKQLIDNKRQQLADLQSAWSS